MKEQRKGVLAKMLSRAGLDILYEVLAREY